MASDSDPAYNQTISERDQLWASLRQLLPEIEQLAAGQFDRSERERQLVQLLARVVAAELAFRGSDAQSTPPEV